MENEQVLRDRINALILKANQLGEVARQVETEAARLGGGEALPPNPPIPLVSGEDLLPLLELVDVSLTDIGTRLTNSLNKLRSIHRT
jgi:hypothetical protein